MLKRSLVLAALCGMSFAATAVTIDLRHEFIDGGKSDKSNADPRLRFHRFANGLGLLPSRPNGARVATTVRSPIQTWWVMDDEDTISWRWKATSNFSSPPGLPLRATTAAPSTSRTSTCNTASTTASMSPLAIAMNTPVIRTTPVKMMTKLTAATRGPGLRLVTGVQS